MKLMKHAFIVISCHANVKKNPEKCTAVGFTCNLLPASCQDQPLLLTFKIFYENIYLNRIMTVIRTVFFNLSYAYFGTYVDMLRFPIISQDFFI